MRTAYGMWEVEAKIIDFSLEADTWSLEVRISLLCLCPSCACALE